MLRNREGQKVPQVSFRTRAGNDWKTVSTDDVFKGRTVVVFSLPGAFTPTCSSTHLPRYNELAPTFSKPGNFRSVTVLVATCCAPCLMNSAPMNPQYVSRSFARTRSRSCADDAFVSNAMRNAWKVSAAGCRAPGSASSAASWSCSSTP